MDYQDHRHSLTERVTVNFSPAQLERWHRMISMEECAFRTLVKLGGVANGRQLAKALGIAGDHATHKVGQIMGNLIPHRVERLGDSVYKIIKTGSR